MRRSLLPLIACLLFASAPASAQRMSLADRVATLEARAANNQGNVELLNQIAQLRTELQALRAQVEELQHQNRQLEESMKAQYLDVDSRITRLEGGTPGLPAAPAAPGTGESGLPTPPPVAPSDAAPAPGPAESLPSVHGDAGSLATLAAGEREAYDAAFSALKAGQYADAAQRFLAFLEQFPSGVYAPNALYWLGESYYVTQNYDLAVPQFQALLDRYPTHDKAPGALLKVGLSQYGRGDLDAAEATLGQVGARYPGTEAARTAADRLAALRLSRVR